MIRDGLSMLQGGLRGFLCLEEAPVRLKLSQKLVFSLSPDRGLLPAFSSRYSAENLPPDHNDSAHLMHVFLAYVTELSGF